MYAQAGVRLTRAVRVNDLGSSVRKGSVFSGAGSTLGVPNWRQKSRCQKEGFNINVLDT